LKLSGRVVCWSMGLSENIVILGGSFDPVHHGHLIVARAAAERLGFEKVLLVPAASPPHKAPARAAPEHRLAMLKLAIEGEELFEVCDLELRRRGPSYTFDTLTELRSQRPGAEVHWIIGTDMLEDLPRWHRAAEVVDLARILIVARWPWQQRLEEIFAQLMDQLGPQRIDRLRQSVLPTPAIDISSSDIRRRVRAGSSIRYLVPEPVGAYIEKNEVYA